MTFGGICITTPDAQHLAAFYRALFQAEPLIEGSHYGFGSVSIWDPGDAEAPRSNPVWLQCFDPDIDVLYQRLLRDIPDIRIISPPERNGGILFKRSSLPYSTPIPIGASILCPEKATKSASSSFTSTG